MVTMFPRASHNFFSRANSLAVRGISPLPRRTLPLPQSISVSPQPGGLGFLPVDPPQYRPQPEQQLLGQKGFGDIVVRPEAQPVEPGLVLVPCREEEHRQIPRLAQLAQKGKPVPVRQHHVQQYRIRGESAELFQGLAAGEGRRRRIARLGQDLAHHALEGGLVVHD